MSPWEVYKRDTGPKALSGCVSVRKGGMTVAADVVDHYFDGFDHAVMLFNPEEDKAGIKPDESKGYKVKITKSGSAIIACGAYVKKFDIKHSKYPLSWNNKHEILTFNPDFNGEKGKQEARP